MGLYNINSLALTFRLLSVNPTPPLYFLIKIQLRFIAFEPFRGFYCETFVQEVIHVSINLKV